MLNHYVLLPYHILEGGSVAAVGRYCVLPSICISMLVITGTVNITGRVVNYRPVPAGSINLLPASVIADRWCRHRRLYHVTVLITI